MGQKQHGCDGRAERDPSYRLLLPVESQLDRYRRESAQHQSVLILGEHPRRGCDAQQYPIPALARPDAPQEQPCRGVDDGHEHRVVVEHVRAP